MKLWSLLFILLGVLGSGCGRSDTIYSDGEGGLVVIERSALPDGFYDQSVNRADAMVADGALRLRVRGGDAVEGSFVDSTLIGSRAIVGVGVGVGAAESTPLRDLDVQVDSSSSSVSSLRVSVLVDLKCEGQGLRSIETTLPVGAASLSSAVWTPSFDSNIVDPVGATVLSSTPSSLTALLAAYPSACLKNGVSDSPEAPKAIPMAALQLSLGSGSTVSASELLISSLTINGKTTSSWSSP